MSDDVRMPFFDVDPAVPHRLIGKIAVFRNAKRIDLSASAIVFGSAMMCVRIGKNDVDAARTDTLSGAGTSFPIVEPADYVLDCVRILIAVIFGRALAAVERPVTVFVKSRREFIPIL